MFVWEKSFSPGKAYSIVITFLNLEFKFNLSLSMGCGNIVTCLDFSVVDTKSFFCF